MWYVRDIDWKWGFGGLRGTSPEHAAIVTSLAALPLAVRSNETKIILTKSFVTRNAKRWWRDIDFPSLHPDVGCLELLLQWDGLAREHIAPNPQKSALIEIYTFYYHAL